MELWTLLLSLTTVIFNCNSSPINCNPPQVELFYEDAADPLLGNNWLNNYIDDGWTGHSPYGSYDYYFAQNQEFYWYTYEEEHRNPNYYDDDCYYGDCLDMRIKAFFDLSPGEGPTLPKWTSKPGLISTIGYEHITIIYAMKLRHNEFANEICGMSYTTNSGTNWTSIDYQHSIATGGVTVRNWTLVEVELGPDVSDTNSLQIRWEMSYNVTQTGKVDMKCYIDEIKLCGTPPTTSPTDTPSRFPTTDTIMPSGMPTMDPTSNPSQIPTTSFPTQFTYAPTKIPTDTPSKIPTTSFPTQFTYLPTRTPTEFPSKFPTDTPSNYPTMDPTYNPSELPTYVTQIPTSVPTDLITTEQSMFDGSTTNSEQEFGLTPTGDEIASDSLTLIVYGGIIFCGCCCFILVYIRRNKKQNKELQKQIQFIEMTEIKTQVQYDTKNTINHKENNNVKLAGNGNEFVEKKNENINTPSNDIEVSYNHTIGDTNNENEYKEDNDAHPKEIMLDTNNVISVKNTRGVKWEISNSEDSESDIDFEC